MKTLLLILIAGVAGCSSVPPPRIGLVPVDYQGTRYMNVPEPIGHLQVGDLVLMRGAGQLIAARVLAVRGLGVYRVEGPDLALLTESNYVGKLYPWQPVAATP